MNAIPKTHLLIKAQHIGLMMKLAQGLSGRKQNLIFARNGTSFFRKRTGTVTLGQC